MSGKDANTMKKHIGRFLSVLLCLQLLFGMIPLPGLDEHDHDHEHVLGGIVLPVNAWDTTSECEFCNAFIADDYICDCSEGGDHCSAESGRIAGGGVALTAKYSQKPGFHEKARYRSCTQRRIPASS